MRPKVKDAVAFGDPSTVTTKYTAARGPLDCDRADHADGPRIEHTANLNDFMRCSAHENIEVDLARVRILKRISPVAEETRTIAGEIDARNGDTGTGGAGTELRIKNLLDSCEHADSLAVPRIDTVAQLDGSARQSRRLSFRRAQRIQSD